ncbi:TPA: hypothetical protein ACY3LZ_005442, partial [Citrobacter freundii]
PGTGAMSDSVAALVSFSEGGCTERQKPTALRQRMGGHHAMAGSSRPGAADRQTGKQSLNV